MKIAKKRVLMTERINLRRIFDSDVRNYLFNYLTKGPLQGWDYQTVLTFVDEAIEVNKRHIDAHLYEQKVTLLNMKEHVKIVVDKFLIPYLSEKRVK
jgi:hypothetical protein